MTSLAIVNPASGGGRCGRSAPRALGRLASRGRSLDVVMTGAAGDAVNLAAAARAEGRTAFVVMGGDGALFEVLNGLAATCLGDPAILVAVAPLGTGNSLARDLPEVTLDAVADGQGLDAACAIDLLRVTCRERTFYCANMLSFGFAGAVGRIVNDHLKPLGPIGYSLGVVWALAGLAPHLLPYRLGDRAFRRDKLTLLSVANSRYTGAGMLMAPDARIDDGIMDIVSGGVLGRLELLRLFPRIFDGSHVAHRAVRQEKAASIEFDFPGPVGLIADGEFFEATPLRVDIVPAAMRMVAVTLP